MKYTRLFFIFKCKQKQKNEEYVYESCGKRYTVEEPSFVMLNTPASMGWPKS